MTVFVTD